MEALFELPADDGELFRPDELSYNQPTSERSNGAGQRTITYRDLHGRTSTAEVWSDGPLPNTVWALTSDRAPIVIDTSTYTERTYTTPEKAQRP